MDFKQFYRMLTEKKDHIINRLEKLTDEQKKEIIDFFNKKPNLEGKIDWNNKNLTYQDFEPIIKERSKTEVKKAVNKSGIAGLVEGEDYRELPLKVSGNTPVYAYLPLNYNASRLIASDKIGGCEGKWCTAYQKTDQYWNSYTGSKGIILIYFIMGKHGAYPQNKFAMAVYPNNETVEVFNEEDRSVEPDSFYKMLEADYFRLWCYGIKNAKNQIMSQTKLFDEVREYIKTHRPIAVLTENDIEELARQCIRKVLDMRTRKINEKIMTIAKNKVEKEYNVLQELMDEARPSKDAIKEMISNNFQYWSDLYNKIMYYMGTQYELAENSLANKINAFTYCDWGELGDGEIEGSDLQDRLKEMKWSQLSYGKLSNSYEDLMKFWFNELAIHSFDKIPIQFFTKWLIYNYKKNYKEFEKCKENFVDDFSSAEYFNMGTNPKGKLTVRPYSSILSDDQKEYINNIINKVEKSEYSKSKQQLSLKL